MSDKEQKYREHAKSLSKDVASLIAKIIEKHDAAILEEMHDQLKAKVDIIESLEGKSLKLLDTITTLQQELDALRKELSND